MRFLSFAARLQSFAVRFLVLLCGSWFHYEVIEFCCEVIEFCSEVNEFGVRLQSSAVRFLIFL